MVINYFANVTVLLVLDFADDILALSLEFVLHDVHLVLLPSSEQIGLSLVFHALVPHFLVVLLEQGILVVQVLLLQLLRLHHH